MSKTKNSLMALDKVLKKQNEKSFARKSNFSEIMKVLDEEYPLSDFSLKAMRKGQRLHQISITGLTRGYDKKELKEVTKEIIDLRKWLNKLRHKKIKK